MKTCFKFFFLFLFFALLIIPSEAAFVSYTDINGKKHIVNTDYNKVPDRYLSQVEEQLKKIKNSTPEAGVPENLPPANEQQTLETDQKTPGLNTPVEVFVKTNCQDCARLLALLDVHKIKFSSYDVENSQVGIDFYKTSGNAELPITRIGPSLIYGNDINAIRNVLNPPVVSPNVTAAPTGPSPVEQVEQSAPAVKTSEGYGGYRPGEYFKIKPLLGNKK